MSKKAPLHDRVKALEDNQTTLLKSMNDLIERHNKMMVDLDAAFKKVGDDRNQDRKKIENIENVLLMNNFKPANLPPGGIIKP